jgi:hypothetical protein
MRALPATLLAAVFALAAVPSGAAEPPAADEAARPALLEALDTEDNEETYRAIIWSLSQIGGEDVQIVLYNLADATQDDDLAEFIEEALENLTFTEDMERYDLLAFNPDEPEE